MIETVKRPAMVGLGVERDRVVLDFGGRRDCLQFAPFVGQRFAEEADRCAAQCEAWEKAGGKGELIKGEPVAVRVQSWDGKINVKFDRTYDRLLIPYRVMRVIADQVRSKVTEARFRVHLAVGAVNAVTSE